MRYLFLLLFCCLLTILNCGDPVKPAPCEGSSCAEGATDAQGDGGAVNFDIKVDNPAAVRWSQVPSTTKEDLWDVQMPTDAHAWAVGGAGTILASTDSGKTWTAQKSGVTVTLRSVFFINAKEGWVVGDQGTIIKTVDGGEVWTQLKSPVSDSLWGVQFLSSGIGFAVGDGFSLLRTTNGGELWRPTSFKLDFDLRRLHFFDSKVGYVVGSQGTILYTDNGALTIATTPTGSDRFIRGVSFVEKGLGWSVGDDGQLFTKEGDDNWRKVDAGLDGHLFGVWFPFASRGWTVGLNGTIWGTRDAGKTWSDEARQTLPDLYAITGRQEHLGLIVGKAGTILRLEEIKGECEDGKARDCYAGPAATKGVGRCVGGKQTCKAGIWGVCVGQIKPAGSEICFNDVDDNCNGKSEKEDKCPECKENERRDCYTGPKGTQDVGACVQGVQFCRSNKWDVCDEEVLPGKELCNGVDDDCDGKVDNDPVDPPLCDRPIGVCSTGRKICKDGIWQTCVASQFGADYEVKESKCDGKDNDCDGTIDETCACTKDGETRECYGGLPDTVGKGTCAKGVQTCTSGNWTECTGEVTPAKEICEDKQDNDCDGSVDEKTQFALACNGTWSYASVPSAPALEPTDALTIEGWFKIVAFPSSRSDGAALLSKSQEGGYSIQIATVSRRRTIRFRVWPNGGKAYAEATVSTSGLIDLGKWHHIAGTFDGKIMRLWIDGKQAAERPMTAAIGYDKRNVPLVFGAEADVGGISKQSPMHMVGQIAQVRFSNKAVYDKNFTPDCVLAKTADTVGLWLLEEGQGTKIADQGGLHHGAWNGPRWDEAPRCPGFSAGGGCETKAP